MPRVPRRRPTRSSVALLTYGPNSTAHQDADHARAGLAEQKQAAREAAAERKAYREQQQASASELDAMRAELIQERKVTVETREKAAGLADNSKRTQAQASALLARRDNPQAGAG